MKKIISFSVLVCGIAVLLLTRHTAAQTPTSGFSIQVTPSPIVDVVKPGQTKTIEVKIRNTAPQNEQLKMGLRAFSVNSQTGAIDLKTEEPADVKDWVQFSDPIFDVTAGEWFTQHVTFAVPENAGFSYSFALLISRAKPVAAEQGKTAIEGSVAIFTLLSVDRPGATRKLEAVEFSASKKLYEYIPTTFTLKLKNSGNTILQPAGNIFVQRQIASKEPIAVLPVNSTGAYILPDSSRSVSSQWSDGFPVYKQSGSDENKQKLVWNWGDLQKLRIGHYFAKAVIVYNDGTRDIPIETTVGFWVVPWKLLLVFVLFIALITVGVVTIVRKTMRIAKKKSHEKKPEKS
jgi:hypothetical protein